jgi:DNA integrity scanning protein DisA with diadenylate cyclase activity
MNFQKFTKQFAALLDLALQLRAATEADAILIVLDGPTEWNELKQRMGNETVLLAADKAEELAGAAEAGLRTTVLGTQDAALADKLTQALLDAVGQEIIQPGAKVVAVYSGFEPDKIDSVSLLSMEEHLGRLTASDLRKLETSVPLETLKLVLDLAVDIGREGREGKPVGTMFVVGDSRRVLAHCHPAGFDPVKGYGRKERNLQDPRVREAVKEIAPLDGAFIVAADATVERSCQLIDAMHANITLSKGLGARHWAAAAISRITKAIAVVVSETSGTVRLFQNGQVVLRVEPFRRAMKWKDFVYEPAPVSPPSSEE